jgi:hypothetical protein
MAGYKTDLIEIFYDPAWILMLFCPTSAGTMPFHPPLGLFLGRSEHRFI